MFQALMRFAEYTYTYTTSQSTTEGPVPASLFLVIILIWLVLLALAVVQLIGIWRMFTKAGKPGWASIVPFYNVWVLAEVAGKPGWWGLYPFAVFVPFVGWIAAVVVSIMIALSLARNFGKGGAFGVFGLWLFSPIGYCILGFGSATYKGAVSGGMPTPPASQPIAPVPPTTPATPMQ